MQNKRFAGQWIAGIGLAVLLAAGTAMATGLDLAEYDTEPGESLEGLSFGPYGLMISSIVGGDVTAMQEGDLSTAANGMYGAPNYGSTSVGPDGLPHGTPTSETLINGCLEGLGFGDLTSKATKGAPGFRFDFTTPVHSLGLRMLDFGDYNPTRSKNHEVVMTAYDADGTAVGSQTLAYTSDGKTNPRSATIDGVQNVDMVYAGDACWAADYADANPGKPTIGLYLWNVTDSAGNGIKYVTLRFGAGYDPNIAFDCLQIEGMCPPQVVDLCAGQSEKAGTVTATCDGSSVCIEYASTDGWEITELHLQVGGSLADFPLTKSGNPKIGRFDTSESYATPVTYAKFCFTYEELGIEAGDTVFIGAHAVVVKGEQEETAWGDGCEGMGFGGKSWATYFSYTTR